MRHWLPLLLALLLPVRLTQGCTGITLTAQNGNVVVARTVEWALSDASHERILIVPRGKSFIGLTPEGQDGFRWEGRHGFVTLTAYGQPFGPDGLNEHGLYVGVYYLPGFAEYSPYEPAQKERSMSIGDWMQWLLSSFSTVEEVLAHLDDVLVVPVENPAFGGAPLPFHAKIADASGNSRIIEFVDGGRLAIYEPYLGVITNAPTYDWHLTNQRNYLGLDVVPQPERALDGREWSPLGGGSGLLGMPGDFTPPSRFVRAAAFTASCRPLPSGSDAVFEAFRILDNFNIPLGAQVPAGALPEGVVGATQITTASDLGERKFYYHTMWNRQVRMIDLTAIDFITIKEQLIDDDALHRQSVKDVTPRLQQR
jgi:choloylglycine hydrolase